MCQRCLEVPGIGKLLLLIYTGFCINSKTITWYGKERQKVGVDREIRESIWGVKERIYAETSVSSTRFRYKNENGSGCFRLCYEGVLSMEGEDGK